jgi:hypothetical protein
LLKLASQGAWIDGADAEIAQARTTIQGYRTALDALTAAQAQVAALPETTESIFQLDQLAAVPAQNGVDEATRQSFQAAVADKRNAISAHAVDAAMTGLAEVQVASLEDLAKLVNYWQAAAVTIPDPNGQQRFNQAFDEAMNEATTRLLPDFQAKLDEMPATLEGVGQVRSAVVDLTHVSGTEDVPVFQPFHNAVSSRLVALIDTMRADNCTALLDELDIGEGDAEQLVWDGDKGKPLGAFVCDLTASGSPVHEYSGAGMLSSTHTMKATLALGGLQTISLHEAEVADGEEMLVGFKMADANQEREISVQDWALFTAMATGGRFVTQEECDRVKQAPEDERSIEDKMIGVDCMVEIINGVLQ